MPIRIESFLSVERSIAQTILRPWERDVGQPIAAKIIGLVRQERFDEADEWAKLINFNAAMEEQLGQLELLGASAFMLGESFFAGGEPGRSGRAEAQVPDEVNIAVATMAQDLQFAQAERVSFTTRDAIAIEKGLVLGTLDLRDAPSPNTNTAGEALIEVQKAVVPGLVGRINAAVMGGGKQVVDVNANLTTSRLVAFGALSEADATGVGTFQITEILDDAICPVCLRMHGRIFRVGPAREQVLNELLAPSPQELAANPWPRSSRDGVAELTSLNETELVERGWNRPPFHPLCRGTLVPVGTVPRADRVPFRPLLPDVSVREQTRRAAEARAEN